MCYRIKKKKKRKINIISRNLPPYHTMEKSREEEKVNTQAMFLQIQVSKFSWVITISRQKWGSGSTESTPSEASADADVAE